LSPGRRSADRREATVFLWFKSRPTHFCGEHPRERRRATARRRELFASHEFETRDLSPASRSPEAQRSEHPGTSGSGSNPERRRERLSTFANSPSSLSPGRRSSARRYT
jgi:hypothetical protein